MRYIVIIILFFTNGIFAQVKMKYTANFDDTLARIGKSEENMDLSKMSKIIIGTYFKDTVKIYVNDTLFYSGLIKTDVSSSIGNEFLINRYETYSFKICFKDESILEFPFDRHYRYLRIDKSKKDIHLLYYNRRRYYN